jgi:60 kDa SS-A/Ro ribonucleoprotein
MERTPGRADEVESSAGGFVFKADAWDRLDRFLILGSEGGTYYVGERELTKTNANTVIELVKQDGLRVVNRIVEISTDGRAHKNDAALFALALATVFGDKQTRRLAYGVMPSVARIGTHLFQFVKFREALGGWGSGMKRAVQRWYNSKDPDKLAYQLLKYRQRDGWSHRDVLRLAHPVTDNLQHRAMFDVTCHPEKIGQSLADLPDIYDGYYSAQGNSDRPNADLVKAYNLSWEMLPTEWLADEAVNRQLLIKMPLMATIRQLGKLTANGTLKPLSPETAMVVERLTNDEQIKRSRIHPMHYLLAVKNYAAGHGFRGSMSWNPDGRIVQALNEGFYKAFANVEPTGKRFLLGVDVSGSMRRPISGSNLSAAEGAAAMAMVIARTEENHFIHGFTSGGSSYDWRHLGGSMEGFIDLGINPKDSLADVCRKTSQHNFGWTDCSLPMQYATQNGWDVDVFIVLTDSETWAGEIKPVDALNAYRRQSGRDAKLIVVGMVANDFTIADPTDSGMLDVVGFDASVPAVISEFVR